MPEPWERQPGESTKAFSQFCTYRDISPSKRSVVVAYRLKTGKTDVKSSAGWFLKLADKWNWIERAAAWDDKLDKERAVQEVEEVREMRKRHAQVGLLLQQKGIERTQQLAPEELGVKDVDRFIETGVSIERLARGEPDSIQEVSGKGGGPIETRNVIDLSKLNTEELQLLNVIFKRMRGDAETARVGSNGEASRNGVSTPEP